MNVLLDRFELNIFSSSNFTSNNLIVVLNILWIVVSLPEVR